jgi:hypothetical protein
MKIIIALAAVGGTYYVVQYVSSMLLVMPCLTFGRQFRASP